MAKINLNVTLIAKVILSGGTMNKLSIYYLSGTHWDREWYQSFQGFRYRLVAIVNDMIAALEKDPNFGVFHFDGQTIVLEDYIEIEPDKRERLTKLIKDKRLIVGPWYVMPDEFLLSGESLIRNLMLGHKLSSAWGSEAWKYGYICDIFGHIAQMPQIFNGFNIKYALLGRGTNEHTTPAHFMWKSPDGSGCITFKLKDSGGYGAFCTEALGWNSRDVKGEELLPKIKKYLDYEIKRSNMPVVLITDAMDHEPMHSRVPEFMNSVKGLYPEADVKNVSLAEMGKELEQYQDQLPVKEGELNEPGKTKGDFIYLITHTLSSRYPLKKANDQCQSLLEKWVDPLTAIAALRGFDIQKSYVDLAYKYLIQNHPHDSICGCSIDQVHKDMEYRFDQTRMIASQIIDSVLEFERNQYTLDNTSCTKVLQIWNPLPFPRNEVITVAIDFPTDYKTRYQEPFGYEEKNSFKIYDYRGREVPYGIVEIKKNYKIRRYNQHVEKADLYTISFEAQMPAMGTAEYKIAPFEEASRYLDTMGKGAQDVENQYIKLSINDNGTVGIYDKVSDKHYTRLLNYIDDGEIGDGWFHANPAEDRIIAGAGNECTIEKVENGPSRTVFRVTNHMKVPAEMDYHLHGIRRSDEYATLKICSLIGLSKGARFVDVETSVFNTAKDHRLRLLLPTGICTGKYFANQPFTFVERKPGVDLDTQSWKECDVPEKQMGGIVGKRDTDGAGLAFVSAYGLHECAAQDDEQGTLYITLFRSFGKTVMTNGEAGGQIQGELKFRYGIMPIQADTALAELIRLQDSMQTGIRATSMRVAGDYIVHQPKSYFELDSHHVCLSVMKRPENGEKDSVVLRCFNMSDKKAAAKIKCFKEMKSAEEINLNEEFISTLPLQENSLTLEIGAWGIKTVRIKL